LFDINNPRLQHIFNKETDELKKSFAALKKTIGEDNVKGFKLEVMICLWFSIHKESLEEAKLIFELDPIAKEIIKTLRESGKEDLALKKMKEDEKKNKGRRLHASSADMSKSMLNNSADLFEQPEEAKVENLFEMNFVTIQDLLDIKFLLKDTECGVPFNTNILRMSLN
jgi:hypothetical protein